VPRGRIKREKKKEVESGHHHSREWRTRGPYLKGPVVVTNKKREETIRTRNWRGKRGKNVIEKKIKRHKIRGRGEGKR